MSLQYTTERTPLLQKEAPPPKISAEAAGQQLQQPKGGGRGGGGGGGNSGGGLSLQEWWGKRLRHYVDEEMGALIRAWHAVHRDESMERCLVEKRITKDESDFNLFRRVLGLNLTVTEIEAAMGDMDFGQSGVVDKDEAQQWWEQYSDDLGKFDQAWDVCFPQTSSFKTKTKAVQAHFNQFVTKLLTPSIRLAKAADHYAKELVEEKIENTEHFSVFPVEISISESEDVPEEFGIEFESSYDVAKFRNDPDYRGKVRAEIKALLREAEGAMVGDLSGDESSDENAQTDWKVLAVQIYWEMIALGQPLDANSAQVAEQRMEELCSSEPRLKSASALAKALRETGTIPPPRDYINARTAVSATTPSASSDAVWICLEIGRDTPASQYAKEHPDKLYEGLIVKGVHNGRDVDCSAPDTPSLSTCRKANTILKNTAKPSSSTCSKVCGQPAATTMVLDLQRDAAQEWWRTCAKKRKIMDKTGLHSRLTSINSLSSLFYSETDVVSDTDRERKYEDKYIHGNSSFDLLVKQWERLHVKYFEKYDKEESENPLHERMQDIFRGTDRDKNVGLRDIMCDLFGLKFSFSEADNDSLLLLEAMGHGLLDHVQTALLNKSVVQQWWTRYCMRDRNTFEHAWGTSRAKHNYDPASMNNDQLFERNMERLRRFLFVQSDPQDKLHYNSAAAKCDSVSGLSKSTSSISGIGVNGLTSHMVQSDDRSGFDIVGDPTAKLTKLIQDLNPESVDDDDNLDKRKKDGLLTEAIELYRRYDRCLNFTLRVTINQGNSLEAKVREHCSHSLSSHACCGNAERGLF
eukprot:COSAG01_NODE_2826_length_7003_cov_149.498117_2_plen_806_part_00